MIIIICNSFLFLIILVRISLWINSKHFKLIHNTFNISDYNSIDYFNYSNSSTKTRRYKHKKFEERVACCGMAFIYKHNFQYHRKWECGKILSCPRCSKVFKTKCSLDNHMKVKCNWFWIFWIYRSRKSDQTFLHWLSY